MVTENYLQLKRRHPSILWLWKKHNSLKFLFRKVPFRYSKHSNQDSMSTMWFRIENKIFRRNREKSESVYKLHKRFTRTPMTWARFTLNVIKYHHLFETMAMRWESEWRWCPTGLTRKVTERETNMSCQKPVSEYHLGARTQTPQRPFKEEETM